MRRDPGCRQLRKDEAPVGDDLGEARLVHHPRHLVRREGPLAGGAPDVDASGVDHEEPRVGSMQGAAQDIEGELVVRGDEDGTGVVGGADSVEAGAHAVVVAPDAPAHPPGAEPVGPGQQRRDARHRADGRLQLAVQVGRRSVRIVRRQCGDRAAAGALARRRVLGSRSPGRPAAAGLLRRFARSAAGGLLHRLARSAARGFLRGLARAAAAGLLCRLAAVAAAGVTHDVARAGGIRGHRSSAGAARARRPELAAVEWSRGTS